MTTTPRTPAAARRAPASRLPAGPGLPLSPVAAVSPGAAPPPGSPSRGGGAAQACQLAHVAQAALCRCGHGAGFHHGVSDRDTPSTECSVYRGVRGERCACKAFEAAP